MKAVVCEKCGSNELVKQGGFYVCQHCGTKHIYKNDNFRTLDDELKIIDDEIKKLENDLFFANLKACQEIQTAELISVSKELRAIDNDRRKAKNNHCFREKVRRIKDYVRRRIRRILQN